MTTIRVGIMGLGHVGSALARALQAIDDPDVRVEVSGDDLADDACLRALGQGFVSRTALDPACDIVLLCVPTSCTRAAVERAHEQLAAPAMLVSCASVQVAALNELRMHASRLGHRWRLAHPMARDEMRGAHWSINFPTSGPLTRLIEATGGTWEVLGEREHDRLVALTSHLPRLLGEIASEMAQAQAPDRRKMSGPDGSELPPLVSGPGWKRLTHGTGEQDELWASIYSDNAHQVASQARLMAARLLERADELDPPLATLLDRLRTGRGRSEHE